MTCARATHFVRHRIFVFLVVVVLIAIDARKQAVAQDWDFSGNWAVAGLNLGSALRSPGSNGLLIGGELSVFHFWEIESSFLGGYVDYLHDGGARTHQVSFGPESGWSIKWLSAGVDAGPVIEFDRDRTRLGVRPRIFVSLFSFSVYAGEMIRLTDAPQRFTTQIGVLLKLGKPTCFFVHYCH